MGSLRKVLSFVFWGDISKMKASCRINSICWSHRCCSFNWWREIIGYELLKTSARLRIFMDSKDLWDSLTTCRQPTENSIEPDVNVLRYEILDNKDSCMSKSRRFFVKSLLLMLFSSEFLLTCLIGKLGIQSANRVISPGKGKNVNLIHEIKYVLSN